MTSPDSRARGSSADDSRDVRHRRRASLPHRPRGLRPPPEGPVAADRPHPRQHGADRGLRAAEARGHRAGAARDPPRREQAGRVRDGERGRLQLPDRGPGAVPRQRLPPARLRLAGHARDPGEHQVGRRPAAAAGDHEAGRGGARDHPAHRHHRLRQVDDARGDDRPHEPDDEEAHHHAGGPDRVPPPGPHVDHQPARGRAGHRVLQALAAPRPAPGPGHDPRRRDARRGDGPDRAVARRRPATSSSRRCTRSTPSRRSTASSTSSRPTRPARPAR